MSPPDRDAVDQESLCRRCGVSCHVAIPLGRRALVVPGLHCCHLAPDGEKRFACRVYADRYKVAPWCHSAAEAAPAGYLAVDCPHGVHPGHGKTQLNEADLQRAWPELLERMLQWGLPVYIDHDALLREVERRTGEAHQLQPWPRDPERLRLVRRGPRQP